MAFPVIETASGTPFKPPYYAVIFTSKREPREGDGYAEMNARMNELAAVQEGYLGIESVGESGPGSLRNERNSITISYWRDESSLKAWKRNLQHLMAQKMGRKNWYSAYEVRVCRVEREYGFLKEGDEGK